MSPQVCKGQLGERSARLPVLRGISACLPSPRAALSFLPADALEGTPYPTFFVNHIPPSSPLLLLSPPSLHPTHILCWLTYGQACVPGNQSKDQLIVPEWNSSLLSSTRLLPLTLLHAQTQPIWKPPISCYQPGLRLGSGHSGIQHLLEWSPDTLPRQHWFGPFSLALLHQTGTSPVVSLSPCVNRLPVRKGSLMP